MDPHRLTLPGRCGDMSRLDLRSGVDETETDLAHGGSPFRFHIGSFVGYKITTCPANAKAKMWGGKLRCICIILIIAPGLSWSSASLTRRSRMELTLTNAAARSNTFPIRTSRPGIENGYCGGEES